MCTPGYDVTLDQFMRIAHLLPRQRGNVVVDNYTMVNALLWMCRTGAPWRDLPECFGKWITVYQRSDRWSRNGVVERLFAALQEERIIAVEVRVLAMDSTGVAPWPRSARSWEPVCPWTARTRETQPDCSRSRSGRGRSYRPNATARTPGSTTGTRTGGGTSWSDCSAG